jgi:hypothetical protein
VKRKKIVLSRASKKQLRDVIRQLKRSVLAEKRAAVHAHADRIRAVLEARGAHVRDLQRVRDRAIKTRYTVLDQLESVLAHDENLVKAACEYIAYGPMGESPERNGVHPFTRWNLETPEAREARLEQEEEEREQERTVHFVGSLVNG